MWTADEPLLLPVPSLLRGLGVSFFSSFFGWTDRGRRTACVVVVHIDRERKNVRFCLFTVT